MDRQILQMNKQALRVDRHVLREDKPVLGLFEKWSTLEPKKFLCYPLSKIGVFDFLIS